MRDDPIVAEVRRVREALAKRHGYDLAAIFADLRQSAAERAQSPQPRQKAASRQRGAAANKPNGPRKPRSSSVKAKPKPKPSSRRRPAA